MATDTAGAAIGFYLQLNDQMSTPLKSIEKGYSRVTKAIDKMNKSVQKRSNSTVQSLESLTSQLENLPSRITRAAKDLQQAVETITTKSGRTSRGRGSSADITNQIVKAVNKALSGAKLRLSPSAPTRSPDDRLWNTRNYRKKWERMPPPADYVGKFQGFADGGEVTGGTKGRDSVPAMLTPGEVVLPVDVVNALRSLLGAVGGPGFAKGGVATRLAMGAYSAAGPMGPMAQFRSAAYVPQQAMGGTWGQEGLSILSEVEGRLGDVSKGLLGWAQLNDSISALRKTWKNTIGIFKSAADKIREKLGLREGDSLISGAAKVGVVASTIAAAHIHDQWVELSETVNQTNDELSRTRRIGYDAMVQFGLANDELFNTLQLGAGTQKRVGDDLEEFVDIVSTMALDNENAAETFGKLIYEMNRYGIATKETRGIFSSMIYLSREYDITLENMAESTESLGDSLRQISAEGGDSKDALIGMQNSMAALSSQWIESSKLAEVFSTALDPEKVQESAGLLGVVAERMGTTQRGARELLKTGEGVTQFTSAIVDYARSLDRTNIGELEAASARLGEIIDVDMLREMGKVSDSALSGMTESFARAAEEAAHASLMQERWNEHAEKLSVIWDKVRKAFYAVFVQLGEPFIAILEPFVQLATAGLQGVAYALNAIGTPLKYVVSGMMLLVAVFKQLLVIRGVVAAIGLLHKGLNNIYSAWVSVGAEVASSGKSMSMFGRISATVSKSLSGLGNAWASMKDRMVVAYDTVKNFLVSSFPGLFKKLGQTRDWIGSKLPKSWGIFQSDVDSAKKSIGGFKESIVDFYIRFRANPIQAVTSDLWSYIKATAAAKWESLKATAVTVKNTVVRWANSASIKAQSLADSLNAKTTARATAATEVSTSVKVKDSAITWLRNAALWAGVTSTQASTLGTWALVSATVSGTAAKVANTIATWASTAATIALSAASWIASSGFVALAVAIWAALSPLLPVIAAVAAVVGVVYLLYKGIEIVVDAVGGWAAVWEGLKKVFYAPIAPIFALWDALKGLWSLFKQFYKSVWQGMKSAVQPLIDEFQKLWRELQSALSTVDDGEESFSVMATLLDAVAIAGRAVGWVLGNVIIPPLKVVIWMFKKVVGIVKAIIAVGQALYDALVVPLKDAAKYMGDLAAGGIGKVLDWVGIGDDEVSASPNVQSFQTGGAVSGSGPQPAVVHGGEVVLPQDLVGALGAFLGNVESGGGGDASALVGVLVEIRDILRTMQRKSGGIAPGAGALVQSWRAG